MPRKGGQKREYVKGSFILSIEHVQLSAHAGCTEGDLIQQKLQGIEVELALTPQSLLVYFTETQKDYFTYYYTERANQAFIKDFNYKMRGGNLMINPILN